MKQKKYVVIAALLLFTSCSQKLQQARIVLLPDTQTYAEKYPEVLNAQINWVLENKNNIDFVLQQGDLTQNNSDSEWKLIQKAFSSLNNKVPYVLAVGNHDMGSTAGKFADIRNTSLFNTYFPSSVMETLPGFAGVAESGKMDNAYYILKTNKINWLVLTLEFGPRNDILEWAGNIIKNYPNHSVIINTHSYIYYDSTRQGPGDSWRPQGYGIGKDTANASVNDGEQIWEKLVKKYPNTRFVFSGHVLNTGVGTLISVNDEGYPVYQMLANYQEGVKGSIKGGNGWMRILDFDFKKRSIKVSTYSPLIEEYNRAQAHNFIIKNVLFETKNN